MQTGKHPFPPGNASCQFYEAKLHQKNFQKFVQNCTPSKETKRWRDIDELRRIQIVEKGLEFNKHRVERSIDRANVALFQRLENAKPLYLHHLPRNSRTTLVDGRVTFEERSKQRQRKIDLENSNLHKYIRNATSTYSSKISECDFRKHEEFVAYSINFEVLFLFLIDY